MYKVKRLFESKSTNQIASCTLVAFRLESKHVSTEVRNYLIKSHYALSTLHVSTPLTIQEKSLLYKREAFKSCRLTRTSEMMSGTSTCEAVPSMKFITGLRDYHVYRTRWKPSLRTFARKSSNIDFFIKVLLKLGYELLLSEMQKNWGVTDFVSEIQYLQGHPIIEKSVFLTRYGSNVRMSKNISNESLEQNFLCQFLYEWVY